MNNKGHTRSVEKYIEANPGSYCRDVVAGTGINKTSVTSAIVHLITQGIVRREGFERRYRYYTTGIKPQGKPKYETGIEGFEFEPVFGCHNPRTAFFNQAIREVRG